MQLINIKDSNRFVEIVDQDCIFVIYVANKSAPGSGFIRGDAIVYINI